MVVMYNSFNLIKCQKIKYKRKLPQIIGHGFIRVKNNSSNDYVFFFLKEFCLNNNL